MKAPSLDLGEPYVPLHHPFPIVARGLVPGQGATLRTQMRDPRGTVWTARGVYVADPTGTVNTARHASISGTFAGLDVGGLFWSLVPPEGDAYLLRLKDEPDLPLGPAPGDLSPLRYELSLHCDGDRICVETIERPQVAHTVTMTQTLPGRLRGQLFMPEDASPKGAVLVLGGSEGGIVPARAAALAADGFAALALGYFDYQDRPKAAVDLPLEYFAEAAAFLQHVTGKPCVIWGGSRGSEAAMLTAIHFPDSISGVIAWVPSHLVNPGFDMASGEDFSLSSTAMWTVGGAPIDGAPGAPVTPAVRAARTAGYSAPPGYSFSSEFNAGWAAVGPESAYAIPVEKINAPLCCISSSDDALWPSEVGGNAIAARRASHGLSASTQHVVLQGCGHAIGMPNMPRPFAHISHWSGGYSGVTSGFVAQGGSPAANAAGAREGWAAARRFLDEIFG